LKLSRPGKPTASAFAEPFNGHFRREWRGYCWFANRTEALEVVEACPLEYNDERPNRGSDRRTPAALLAGWEFSEQAADERMPLTNPVVGSS